MSSPTRPAYCATDVVKRRQSKKKSGCKVVCWLFKRGSVRVVKGVIWRQKKGKKSTPQQVGKPKSTVQEISHANNARMNAS